MLNTSSRKFRVILLAVLAMLSVLCGFAGAMQQTEPFTRSTAADVRIARLAGLGRLWGAVKFFHPYLAYKEVDWDKALIETIPRVNGAKTPEEYNAAINHLLSFLNDRNTRADIVKETKTAANTPTEKIDPEKLVRVVDGVLIVEVRMIAEALAQDSAAFNQVGGKINASLLQAKAIVLDYRGKGELSEFAAFYSDFLTRQLLAQILDSSLTLGSSRYRMHSGYAPQVGTSSGGYYAAFVATTPETIVGRNKAKQLPMAVIVNDKTAPASEVFSGLQSTKRVLVVQEGDGQ